MSGHMSSVGYRYVCAAVAQYCAAVAQHCAAVAQHCAAVAQHMHLPIRKYFSMQNTPLPSSEPAPLPPIKRLASSAPGRSPPKLETGGAFTMWPGRFFAFSFSERGRLLRNMFVFAENSTPGRLLGAGRLLELYKGIYPRD